MNELTERVNQELTHIQKPYSLEEIHKKYLSGNYNAELLLQHTLKKVEEQEDIKRINNMSKEKIMRSDKAKNWRLSSECLLPLELTKDNLHICLWSADETYKWTIGYFDFESEEPNFKFVGERPLDERVDWSAFKDLINLGYVFANLKVKYSEKVDKDN